MLIRRVWENKATKQMLVSIPNKNNQNINPGDHVEIKKIIEAKK